MFFSESHMARVLHIYPHPDLSMILSLCWLFFQYLPGLPFVQHIHIYERNATWKCYPHLDQDCKKTFSMIFMWPDSWFQCYLKSKQVDSPVVDIASCDMIYSHWMYSWLFTHMIRLLFLKVSCNKCIGRCSVMIYTKILHIDTCLPVMLLYSLHSEVPCHQKTVWLWNINRCSVSLVVTWKIEKLHDHGWIGK